MKIDLTTMPSQPTASYLKQRHFLFGSREFVLKGEDAVLVRERSLLSYHETLIPLNTLQANPTYSSSFAIKWLLTSLFIATLTGLTLYLAQHYALPILYVPAIVLGGTTLVVLYRFLLYTTRLTIFRHAVSHENYLYFWRNRPDTRQFEAFINELSRLIRQAHDDTHQV
ncbi:MAG: hypothetical protein R3E95_07440 [Thiolinea sp.]